MRFQVEGVYQGRPIPPKVVEGSSAEAVRRAAEARGMAQVVVFPADDPFERQAQPPALPAATAVPRKKAPVWLLLGLLLLMPAVPFISNAITDGIRGRPAGLAGNNPTGGQGAGFPDEPPNSITIPGDTAGVGRRALSWEPGTTCEILSSKGTGAPIVQAAAFADFEKSLRAQDEIGSFSSAIKGEWTTLQPKTRVRVLGPGPKPGWIEVRVESGEELGTAGMVMAHTLARLQ